MDSPLCFVCSRCEHPICSQSDILTKVVEDGTTENAFVYELEDLLNLDKPVPCYSGDEVYESKVYVSDKILQVSLPPAARLVALEALADSLRAQELEDVSPLGDSNVASSISSNTEQVLGDTNEGSRRNPGDATTGEGLAQTPEASGRRRVSRNPSVSNAESAFSQYLTRFSNFKESRIDLVCIKDAVLGHGLARCTKDRSAEVIQSPSAAPLLTGDDQGTTRNVSAGAGGSASSMAKGALRMSNQVPVPTRRLKHPGNLDVEEGFVHFRRRTKTARCPWFSAYDCCERLECPDCHLGVGFLFVLKPGSRKALDADVETGEEPTETSTSEMCCSVVSRRPQHKRERNEECREEDAEENARRQEGQNGQDDESFPAAFVGLELKKICQRRWGLREFQKRYEQAKDLVKFRSMFPEAEELESMNGRLTALRTQSELYGNLLRKHKEQNDVQYALIESQKERIGSYEEKLNTMQQIIEAQKTQLEMQCRQIRQQEELLRNHKNQVATQQYQIHVEQLLRSEQSRTIESQREQLSLMQAHLRAHIVKEQLTERYDELVSLLKPLSEQRQAPTVPSSPTASSASAPMSGDSCPNLPPAHLLGIIGRDVREWTRVSHEDEGLGRNFVEQESRTPRDSSLPSLQIGRNMPRSNCESHDGRGLNDLISDGRAFTLGIPSDVDGNNAPSECTVDPATSSPASGGGHTKNRTLLSVDPESTLPNARSSAYGESGNRSSTDNAL
uniref:Uncharacterized protein n=1 Tax=Trypanosoma congolense (strain IL3000) TaxID=1068625 RepID=G0UXU9_TRYCI|nr:conserved hypothetical protein [Trypanosoma congolense IL3000]